MRIVHADAPEALSEALAVLQSGGTVVHATETCYGLACDLTNPEAVSKLFAIKKRPLDQPVSALFFSLESARAYTEVSPKVEELFTKHLPGPLTIVLPKRSGAPPLWLTASGSGNDDWIGVRISSHPFATKLAEAYGKPIATTSANIHGATNPYSVADLQAQFSSVDVRPDLLLDSGTLPHAPPSTVVQVVEENLKVLRQGDLSIE